MNALAYKACQEDYCSTLFAPTMLDGRSGGPWRYPPHQTNGG